MEGVVSKRKQEHAESGSTTRKRPEPLRDSVSALKRHSWRSWPKAENKKYINALYDYT